MRVKLTRPSPAMIVALLALFIALGGAAYAVKVAPKNSVKSKSIKNGQVKTVDLQKPTLVRASSNDPNNPSLTNIYVSHLDLQSNGSPPLVLPSPMRVVATATVMLRYSNSGTLYRDATCRLRLRSGTSAPSDVMGVPLTTSLSAGTLETTADGWEATLPLTATTAARVPKGNYDVDVECLADTNDANVHYDAGSLTVFGVR